MAAMATRTRGDRHSTGRYAALVGKPAAGRGASRLTTTGSADAGAQKSSDGEERTGALARLRLIGPFRLTDRAGESVSITSKKARAIIALTVLAPSGRRTRRWLQTMLWGSRFREQAQTSLRRELTNLAATLERHGLGQVLERTADEVAFDIDALDIDVLKLGVGLAPQDGVLAEGVFLEGLDLPGCAEFADWLAKRRAWAADLQSVRMPPVADDAHEAEAIAGGALQTTAELVAQRDLSLPPKPSVCALPFRSTGEVEAFVGPAIAEEVSMTLARMPSLFVVASASAEALAEQSRDPVFIARRLGVRYLIDGAVRQAGQELRVTVNLLDGETGTQVWSQAFTGHRDAIFALQEQVATAIAPQIHTRIDIAELNRGLIDPARSGDAYALYWRANALFRQWDEAAIREAIDICEVLVRMQPASSWAAAMAAFCHAIAFTSGWTENPAQTRRAAVAHYQAAMRHGADDPSVLGYAAGTLVCIGGDVDVAERLIGRALELLPSYQPTLFWGGWVDIARGRPAHARERFELSLRINPMAGARAYAICGIGLALLMQGQMTEAYDMLCEAAQFIPDYPMTQMGLAIAASMTGRADEAARALGALRSRGNVGRVMEVIREPKYRALFEQWVAAQA